MKMLKFGIASLEQYKARTLAIARGEYKPKSGEPNVWLDLAVIESKQPEPAFKPMTTDVSALLHAAKDVARKDENAKIKGR